MFFIHLVMFVSLASSAVHCTAMQSSYKARRGGTVGLFPFPRVGRAQPERTWQISPEDIAELHSEAKRQGLIPFPRVGRSMTPNVDDKSGIWFGSRLGRYSKKAQINEDTPWTMIALREISSQRDYTPRLGRESEELQPEDEQDQNDMEMEPNRTT